MSERQKTELALAIARRLAELGMNQKKLAEKSNLNKNTISMVMTGKSYPAPSTLKRIAKALEMEPEDLQPSRAQPKLSRHAALAQATANELATELAFRINELSREVRELKSELAEARKEVPSSPASEDEGKLSEREAEMLAQLMKDLPSARNEVPQEYLDDPGFDEVWQEYVSTRKVKK